MPTDRKAAFAPTIGCSSITLSFIAARLRSRCCCQTACRLFFLNLYDGLGLLQLLADPDRAVARSTFTRAVPSSQVRRVETFPVPEHADLSGLGASPRFVQQAQLVTGSEPRRLAFGITAVGEPPILIGRERSDSEEARSTPVPSPQEESVRTSQRHQKSEVLILLVTGSGARYISLAQIRRFSDMIRCLIRSKPGTAGLYTSLTMAMRRMLTANQPELGLRPSFFFGQARFAKCEETQRTWHMRAH